MSKKDGERDGFLMKAIPHEEAAERVRGMGGVAREVFEAMSPQLQAQALTITGVECVATIGRVRDLVATLPLGADWEDVKGQILGEISPWLITAEEGEEREKQENAAKRRAEMLLRMHGWQAYAGTQWAEMEAEKEVFPYRQYLTSEDGRVRASHAGLHKKILPADHAFWVNHTPPWEFGCRCDVVALTRGEVERIMEGEADTPREQRQVLDEVMLGEVERGRLVMPNLTGFLDVRTPRERMGKGYEWRPSDYMGNLARVVEGMPAGEKQVFEAWARQQDVEGGGGKKSLWDWVRGVVKKGGKKRDPKVSVSSALVIERYTQKRDLLIDALDLIDQVHGDGLLPKIPLQSAKMKDPETQGYFEITKQQRKAVRIVISVDAQSMKHTLIHEIGHFLDTHVLGGAPGTLASQNKGSRISKIVDLLKRTDSSSLIPAIYNQEDSNYLLSNEEVWARAYAQYITRCVQDDDLTRALELRRKYRLGTQWTDQEFEPAAEMIYEYFKELGWKPKKLEK